jgi:hypothetical protein
MPRVLLWGLAALLFSCDAGPQDRAASAYLLVDREARGAGVELEGTGWRGAPALPVAVANDEAVFLSAALSRTRLEVRPGQLGWIRGGDGRVEWSRVGVDVRPDALALDGSDDAARAVADLVDGRLSALADGFLLEGPDLWERGSFLPSPGVVEARPVPQHGGDVARIGAADGTVLVGTRSMSLSPTIEDAGLVGLYRQGEATLILDADGGYTRFSGCVTERRGRFTRHGTQVTLVGEDDSRAFLALDGEQIIDESGVRLAPIGGSDGAP